LYEVPVRGVTPTKTDPTEGVSIGSKTSGRVVALYVAAGSRVHRGSIVLRLNDALLQSQYDGAVAQQRRSSDRVTELQKTEPALPT
jgi:multidrug efflux pump subunit AcrA (membrane-fusion protein)